MSIRKGIEKSSEHAWDLSKTWRFWYNRGTRRGGVTGSHAGLRILSRKGCGFDSRPRQLHASLKAELQRWRWSSRFSVFEASPRLFLACECASAYHLQQISAAWPRTLSPSSKRNWRMLLRTRMAGLGLAALFIAAVPAQAQTTLRYKFKQGEKLDYVIENKMTMKLDLGGKEIEMAINQNMEMAWKIEAVASDGKA